MDENGCQIEMHGHDHGIDDHVLLYEIDERNLSKN